MVNSSFGTGVTCIAEIHPCEVQIVPKGRDLSGAEWFLPNQVGNIGDLRDIWLFVLGNVKFVRQIWRWGGNKARAEELMFGGTRDRDLRIRNVSWMSVHHHRVWGVTISEAWVGMGVDFVESSMEALLSFGGLSI